MKKRRLIVFGVACAVLTLAWIPLRIMAPHGVYEAEKIGYAGRKFIEFRKGQVVAVAGLHTNLLGDYYYSNANWYYTSSDGEYSVRIVASPLYLHGYDSNDVEDVDFKLTRRWSLRSP